MLAARVAQAHACAGFDEAVAAVRTARTRLVALPQSEDLDPLLGKAARQGIRDSKAGIARLVSARMACAGGDDAQAIEGDLQRAMQSIAGACDERCTRSEYNDVPLFEIARPKDHPQLLALVVRLAIECGSDAMLFVYEYAQGAWRERVRWQSAPYAKVSGAFGTFDYRIAPPDAQGRWYVLVKDIMPWCNSTWSTIRYAVLQPAAAGVEQRVVYRGSDPIWWGNDDVGRIDAGANEFDVRFHANSIDLGVHNREWVRHFAIHGDSVQRVAPIALTPRDFADEWIVRPWSEAAGWALSAAPLETWHKRLHGKDGLRFYDFVAARACAGEAPGVEVELSDDQENRYFLRVDDTAGEWRMTRVAGVADPHCSGEDLLDTMQTQ